jgi:hypothetical protein
LIYHKVVMVRFGQLGEHHERTHLREAAMGGVLGSFMGIDLLSTVWGAELDCPFSSEFHLEYCHCPGESSTDLQHFPDSDRPFATLAAPAAAVNNFVSWYETR